jgi:hypothetical protein
MKITKKLKITTLINSLVPSLSHRDAIERQDGVLRKENVCMALKGASAALDGQNTDEAGGGNPKLKVDAELKVSAQQPSLDAIIAGPSTL